ncbi:IPT/TIG domain-containing protein [Micromonospora sp. NPDC005367]|uniref:IPT/TIG domain-containing protein n=1 Tax=Micromonospora sp. NPDC005367 TaxID=3155590 RepID=UPI0033A7D63B
MRPQTVRPLPPPSALLTRTYLADGAGAEVTGLTPGEGPAAGGTTLTITGSGFGGANGVTFAGVGRRQRF